MPTGDATKNQTSTEPMLRESTLRFTGTVEAQYDLAMSVHDLSLHVCPEASE